jgi:branched-chain amino acid transport system substrate-binding protein
MSKFTRLLALLCAISMLAAACGSDAADDVANAADDAAESVADEEVADEEVADEEVADEEVADGCGANTPDGTPGIDTEAATITIGTSQPFTGRAAVAGEGLLGGIIMAVEEVNANGGIDGCTIELVWEDDRFEIDQMVTNVRKMIEEDGVWGFVGTAGSQSIPATYPAIEGAGTPLWGPVSPADQDIQQVYLTNSTRTEQGRICIDYFAEQGVTKVAAIGQDNELGVEAFAAIALQAPVHGMEIVAEEEVEVLSDLVAPAVLAVIDSGAEGVLTALDGTQNALVMDQFFEAGFSPLMCSDQGSAGAGGATAVGLANPEAADGYLGALQGSLTDSTDPFVVNWAEQWASYDGPGSETPAANFSLQTYSIAQSFFQVIDRLDGNYSYDNFHAVAEALGDDPITVPSMPTIACGTLPGGHSCAAGAGVAVYNAFDDPDGDGVGTWVQVREFMVPAE